MVALCPRRAMARVLWIIAVFMLVPCSWAGLAHAAYKKGAKPLILILLDTSASMEYLPDWNYVIPDCATDFNPTFGAHTKSKLIMAQELLTGTFENYWCQYTYPPELQKIPSLNGFTSAPGILNGLFPHAMPCAGMAADACTNPTQKADGLMDILRDRARFSLMTTDSWPQWQYTNDGMWSYPQKAKILPTTSDLAKQIKPWLGDNRINLGVKNARWGDPDFPNEWDGTRWVINDENAGRSQTNHGQLVPPPATDVLTDLRHQNRVAQAEVIRATTAWGSPLAAMFNDVYYFFKDDPDVKAYDPSTGQGDPLYECRTKIIIWISDGQANQEEWGYGDVLGNMAKAFYLDGLSGGAPIFFVNFMADPFGLDTPNGYLTSADESLLNASSGFEWLRDLVLQSNRTFLGPTVNALKKGVLAAIAQTQHDPETETEIITTDATWSTLDRQYQFGASWQVDNVDNSNLEGFLEQTIYRCSNTCAGVTAGGLSCPQETLNLHERLNDMPSSHRSLYASFHGEREALDVSLLNQSHSGVLPSDFAVPTTGRLPQPLSNASDTYDATDHAQRKQYVQDLIKHIRADDDSLRAKKRLGAITRSTPVIQQAASQGQYPLASWKRYVQGDTAASEGQDTTYGPKCRPTMLYAGTHDGLLHAFRVDHFEGGDGRCSDTLPAQSDQDVGKESWAIIPHHLLKRAHNLVGRYDYLMDGQINVADVLLGRTAAAVGKPEIEAEGWRSVLTMGYGRGGRGHLALDVTRALEGPTVMWEIDNERYCRDGNCSPFSLHDAFDYQLLGLTTAKPAYGTLFVDGEERAVVMLPGGVSPETAGDPNVAKVVYLTDLEVGHKIAEFSVPMQNIYSYGSKVTKTEKLFDFSGSAVMYPNTPGTVSTRAFLGDGGGRIWRLDMGNPNPNKWRLELFFDPYSEISALAAESDRPMPILGAPSITINDLGQLTLIYGLGHPDYVVESSKSRVATLSVSEVTSAQGEVSANLNWHRILDPYERLSAPPNVYDKVAYFTTYVTDAINACADGEGRLYGIHFTEHTGGDNDDTSVGALDEDGDATTHDPVKYIELGDAVVRAVRIVQRPACAPGAAGGSGGGGSGSSGATRGDVELVLSVAQGGDYATSTSSSNTMTAAKGKAPVLKRTMTHSGETFQSGAWGYVLY